MEMRFKKRMYNFIKLTTQDEQKKMPNEKEENANSHEIDFET